MLVIVGLAVWWIKIEQDRDLEWSEMVPNIPKKREVVEEAEHIIVTEDPALLAEYRADKKEYLYSEAWWARKTMRKEIDNYTCQMCGDMDNLVVHHVTYENLKSENMEDLVTLCPTCHTRLHDIVGYPNSLADYATERYEISSTKL